MSSLACCPCKPRILAAFAFAALFFYSQEHAWSQTVPEAEPNDINLLATPLDDGECGDGDIDPDSDVDIWSRADALEDDIVFAYVFTVDSTDSTDSTLEVRSPADATLDSDDDDGEDDGSAVAGLVLTSNGTIRYRIDENGGNAEITPYTLYQILANPADIQPEIDPNGTALTATAIDATIMTGDAAIGEADVDFYAVELAELDIIAVIVDEDPDDDGDRADTILELIDPDGVTVIHVADTTVDNSNANAMAFEVPAAGTYFIKITNDLGPGTEYSFVTLVNCLRSCEDTDSDQVCDASDNCDEDANYDQEDTDGDGFGDACDLCEGDDATGDDDADGICTEIDNCPDDANADQDDDDGDDVGDACDLCEGDDATGDDDEDGICDDNDLCIGDDASGDDDDDGVCDSDDECPADPEKSEEGQCGCGEEDTDSDDDGTADCNDECPENEDKTEPGECGCEFDDADADGDGILNCDDNCPTEQNFDQEDSDDDAIGDRCDSTPNGECGFFGIFFGTASMLMAPFLLIGRRKLHALSRLRS
ncbi:MAG TPA: hypothetical protein VNT79_16385 [Phycisphaerae bacterium]|nr:hypothetical protein [Phycisphaerae bacterium]